MNRFRPSDAPCTPVRWRKAALCALLEELEVLRSAVAASGVATEGTDGQQDDEIQDSGDAVEENDGYESDPSSLSVDEDAGDGDCGAGEGGTILALLAQRDELLRCVFVDEDDRNVRVYVVPYFTISHAPHPVVITDAQRNLLFLTGRRSCGICIDVLK